MARLNTTWYNFSNRGQTWYHFWQDTEVSVQYDITADVASYLFSGSSVAFRKSLISPADIGSFVFTGSATLQVQRVIPSAVQNYSLSGVSIFLMADRLLSAGTGTFLFSGTSASFTIQRKITVDAATHTLSGTSVTLLYGKVISVVSGSYSFSGSGSLFVQRKLIANSASLILSGESILGKANYFVAGSGAYTFTVYPASLDATFLIPDLVAGVGIYTLSGGQIRLLKNIKRVSLESGIDNILNRGSSFGSGSLSSGLGDGKIKRSSSMTQKIQL